MALMPDLVNVEQIVGPSGMERDITFYFCTTLFRWVSAIFTFVLGQNCNENRAVNFIFEIPVQYPLVDSCRSVKNVFFNDADCVMQSLLAVIKNISSAWNVKKFRRKAQCTPHPTPVVLQFIPCSINSHFPENRGKPVPERFHTGLYWSKDDGGGGVNWSSKTCKAPVRSSSPINQTLKMCFIILAFLFTSRFWFLLLWNATPPVLWFCWFGNMNGIWSD